MHVSLDTLCTLGHIRLMVNKLNPRQKYVIQENRESSCHEHKIVHFNMYLMLLPLPTSFQYLCCFTKKKVSSTVFVM